MRKSILLIALIGIVTSAFAQNTPITKSNYDLAERFSPKKLSKMVHSLSVNPNWLKSGDKFWYSYKTPEGTSWFIVDPIAKTQKNLFDNADMAAQLTLIVKDPIYAKNLGLSQIKFSDDASSFTFLVRGSTKVDKKQTPTEILKKEKVTKENEKFYFKCDVATGKITHLVGYEPEKKYPSWANVSPDGSKAIFAKTHNLYILDRENLEKAMVDPQDSTIVERQITTDGIEGFDYGGNTDRMNNVDAEKKKNDRMRAYIAWSPDSNNFAIEKSDDRKVKKLWVINPIAQPRPVLETYYYQMPGEEGSTAHLLVFDVNSLTSKEVDIAAYKDQTISISVKPILKKDYSDTYKSTQWSGTNDTFFFSRLSRDLKRIDVCKVNLADMSVKPIIEERMNTYQETRSLKFIKDYSQVIQWSERDGWAHFYLYGTDGKLINQITRGEMHCENIIGVNETTNTLYFTAHGGVDGENPYYLHTFSINLDGSSLKLLNPGNFDHQVNMSDDAKYFVDNYSRVDTAPMSVLYNKLGQKIIDLQEADLSQLFAYGYEFPEPFTVKADDGVTDLYGVMYKPVDFDSTKLYPIIEYVYPGPQTEAVDASFSTRMTRTNQLAQLGFVVITIGNRGGSPQRSKWYHNYGYDNMRDYGLADKKRAVEALAARHNFIDVNKVGIHGHSGGGFMSTAAMFVYPDFFKVAVSSAGNHDNNIYNRWWSETHHGVDEVVSEKGDTTFVYKVATNPELAKNLKGKLMLSTGEIDNNVHPGNTMRVVNALIKANKRFELVVLPTQRHGYGDMTDYFFWRSSDYFTQHLIGDSRRDVTHIEELCE